MIGGRVFIPVPTTSDDATVGFGHGDQPGREVEWETFDVIMGEHYKRCSRGLGNVLQTLWKFA